MPPSSTPCRSRSAWRVSAILALAIITGCEFAAIGGVEPAGACDKARRLNHWCKAGNIGYVAGLEIRPRFLYEVLDPHGHDVDPKAMRCEVCRRALKSHGYCPAHRMGYVGGRAYMTPLTYYLARGRPVDPGRLSCPICREHTRGIGWCDRDRVGIVGTTALDNREEFEELSKAYRILVAAIEKSKSCERCSGAMVADGYCAIHRIKYADGLPVPGFGVPPPGAGN
jgi:hypothetical protein